MTETAEEPRVRARLIDLTPELAGKMLKSNTHNRSVSGSRVEQYAADMRAGNLFAVVDQTDADDFLRKLMRGENLSASDAIWVLRERLIKAHGDRLNGLHSRVKLAFVIRAWNAYRANEPMVRLVWQGGSNPDRFPHIDGLAVHTEHDTPEEQNSGDPG